jgi:hypothetical protein
MQRRAFLLLEIKRAGKRDVAVEMALVKLVEDQCGDACELWIIDHLAEQDAFGHEPDLRLR